MRRFLVGVAVGAAVLTTLGCGVATSTDDTSAAQPATRRGSAEVSEPIIVRGAGALIRPFAAKSLREFATDPYVVGVVRGTVTRTEAMVIDGNVRTLVTVAVQNGLGLRAGSVLEVSEPGGVVPMSEVRSQFEGKEWQKPLTSDDLSRPVDYQMEGFPHSSTGEDVVMFLATGSGSSDYTLATKLVPSGPSFRFKNDEPPNPAWSTEVPAMSVDAMIQESAR